MIGSRALKKKMVLHSSYGKDNRKKGLEFMCQVFGREKRERVG